MSEQETILAKAPTTSDQQEMEEPDQPLSLEIVHAAGDWDATPKLEEAVAAVIQAVVSQTDLITDPVNATVVLSSDAEVRALNAQFRGKDKPTNVLSFPADLQFGQEPGGQRELGDVILAAETVQAEANATGIPVIHHFQHLVLHGLLHLLGYDHEEDAAAEQMEALEIEILRTLGIANPYAEGVK